MKRTRLGVATVAAFALALGAQADQTRNGTANNLNLGTGGSVEPHLVRPMLLYGMAAVR